MRSIAPPAACPPALDEIYARALASATAASVQLPRSPRSPANDYGCMRPCSNAWWCSFSPRTLRPAPVRAASVLGFANFSTAVVRDAEGGDVCTREGVDYSKQASLSPRRKPQRPGGSKRRGLGRAGAELSNARVTAGMRGLACREQNPTLPGVRRKTRPSRGFGAKPDPPGGLAQNPTLPGVWFIPPHVHAWRKIWKRRRVEPAVRDSTCRETPRQHVQTNTGVQPGSKEISRCSGWCTSHMKGSVP